MNVTLEDLSPCKKRVKIEIPASRVQQTYDKIAADFQKEARLPGFRAGHAPKNLVTKKYHKDIEAETQRALMPEALSEVVKENKFVPVSAPVVLDKNFVSGVSFVFTAEVEIAPKVTLPIYKGIKLTRHRTEVTDQEVDTAIYRLADQQAGYEDITERPAEKGDFMVITYEGSKEGKPLLELFPNIGAFARGEDFWLWTETPDFIPGFIEPCLGMNLEESREFSLEMPADYELELVSGSKLEYKVTLKGLKKKIPVAIDEELAKKLGQTDLAGLRTAIKGYMESDKVKKLQQAVRGQVIDQLLKDADFAVPNSILEQETENSVRMMVEENQKRGITPQMLQEQQEEIYKAAARDATSFVRLNYISSEIARAENLKPTDDMIIQHLSAYAEATKQSPKKVLKEVQEYGLPVSISSQLTRGLVLEFVVRHAEFVDEEGAPFIAPAPVPATPEESVPALVDSKPDIEAPAASEVATTGS